MSKPKFIQCEFRLYYDAFMYAVIFTPLANKRHYQIIVRYDTDSRKDIIENYTELEMATKTTALFYLCKALNIPTKNIR